MMSLYFEPETPTTCILFTTMKNPFEPLGSKTVVHSSHPKTSSNRKHLLAKIGLELSLVRSDAAFRTAKSRALKKLRKSKGYLAMSAEEKKEAEQHTIDELELE